MLQQQRFSEDLALILTPLPLRDVDANGEAPEVDTSTWYNTPGVAVAAASSPASGDYTICHAEWGARKLPGGPSPDKNTLFQACSISKPFQGLAILHYISEGVISGLDDPIKLYLSHETYDTLLHNSIQKGVPEKLATELLDKMTIIQLLSHTAGTTTHGFQGYSISSSHVPSVTEVLQGGMGNANSPIVHIAGIPGVQYQYSGGGSTILQAMLENIGRRDGFTSFATLMKAKVLDPLGMDRSLYCDASALSRSEINYGTGYHNGTHGLEVGEYHIHPEQGAAGLWTTPSDLVKGMTGFARSLLGTASAVKLQGKPWIKPEVAQELLHRRTELAHGQQEYYCCFRLQFFDGKDNLARDKHLVCISHGGANYGYRCWAAATFTIPDKLQGGKEDTIIKAQATMTNSNYGDEIIRPLTFAISEILDSPLGPGLSGHLIPAVALDITPVAPAPGWEAYEGIWGMDNRTQTLHITVTSEPTVEFSHLAGIQLPLWAVAERRDAQSLRLRVSTLEVALELGWTQELDDVTLILCTGGSRVKCCKQSALPSS